MHRSPCVHSGLGPGRRTRSHHGFADPPRQWRHDRVSGRIDEPVEPNGVVGRSQPPAARTEHATHLGNRECWRVQPRNDAKRDHDIEAFARETQGMRIPVHPPHTSAAGSIGASARDPDHRVCGLDRSQRVSPVCEPDHFESRAGADNQDVRTRLEAQRIDPGQRELQPPSMRVGKDTRRGVHLRPDPRRLIEKSRHLRLRRRRRLRATRLQRRPVAHPSSFWGWPAGLPLRLTTTRIASLIAAPAATASAAPIIPNARTSGTTSTSVTNAEAAVPSITRLGRFIAVQLASRVMATPYKLIPSARTRSAPDAAANADPNTWLRTHGPSTPRPASGSSEAAQTGTRRLTKYPRASLLPILAAWGSSAVAMAEGISRAALARLLATPYSPTGARPASALRTITSALSHNMKKTVCSSIGATKRAAALTRSRFTSRSEGRNETCAQGATTAIAARLERPNAVMYRTGSVKPKNQRPATATSWTRLQATL